MSRKINYKKKFIELIHELHADYPSYDTARHLSTALADYGDFWGLSDKELCFAIEKYKEELQLDILNISPQAYVDKIVKEANELFDDSIQLEEEEDFE